MVTAIYNKTAKSLYSCLYKGSMKVCMNIEKYKTKILAFLADWKSTNQVASHLSINWYRADWLLRTLHGDNEIEMVDRENLVLWKRKEA